jgi:hypothetical protein
MVMVRDGGGGGKTKGKKEGGIRHELEIRKTSLNMCSF